MLPSYNAVISSHPNLGGKIKGFIYADMSKMILRRLTAFIAITDYFRSNPAIPEAMFAYVVQFNENVETL